MVLLKLKDTVISIPVDNVFTFQYGATKTAPISKPSDLSIGFTFQYGATKTNFRFGQYCNTPQFTFQYGATKTLLYINS